MKTFDNNSKPVILAVKRITMFFSSIYDCHNIGTLIECEQDVFLIVFTECYYPNL